MFKWKCELNYLLQNCIQAHASWCKYKVLKNALHKLVVAFPYRTFSICSSQFMETWSFSLGLLFFSILLKIPPSVTLSACDFLSPLSHQLNQTTRHQLQSALAEHMMHYSFETNVIHERKCAVKGKREHIQRLIKLLSSMVSLKGVSG